MNGTCLLNTTFLFVQISERHVSKDQILGAYLKFDLLRHVFH